MGVRRSALTQSDFTKMISNLSVLGNVPFLTKFYLLMVLIYMVILTQYWAILYRVFKIKFHWSLPTLVFVTLSRWGMDERNSLGPYNAGKKAGLEK